MGVRFQCPSGHKLHVKAELAGRRGVCPECGAKFVVPSFSGGRVAAEAPNDSVVIHTQTPPPIAPPTPATTPSTATNPEPLTWYVRPADGGQFGPATTEVFHQWIEDGRVAVDSWVWRTGWADWRAGGEALALIADRPPLNPAAAIVAALEVSADASPLGATAHPEPGSAEARRAEIKRRKKRVRTVSTVLALVALAMLMALVFVLAR